MFATNQHVAAAHLPPERAHALETLCAALANELTFGATRSAELDARFGAMQNIVTRTIKDVSREWNLSHDHLRVLPVELRAMCWSYLPQADVARLARVCSSWRELSEGMPSLWTSIVTGKRLGDLDALFSRSGQSPFDVSVLVHSVQDYAYVDDCVRNHAQRLRSLQIMDRGFSFAGASRGEELFRYPAPMLERFSLRLISPMNDGKFTLAPDIFTGCAPNLRSVTLYQVPFPSVCAAFSRITTLNIGWSLGLDASGLQHIFTVSPGLAQLGVSGVLEITSIPVVPPSSKLRKMTLNAEHVSFALLRDLGYLAIPELEATAHDPRAVYDAGLHLSPSLHATMSLVSISGTATAVILRGLDGAKATFIADDMTFQTPGILLRNSSQFQALQRLVLPITTRHHIPGPNGVEQYPYLDADLPLPALHTLALSPGRPEGTSILAPAAVIGALVAPRLARVEIVNSPHSRSGAVVAVSPGRLAVFIDAHIQCHDAASLEVFVDPENNKLLDVGDEDGMERLRRCVGKIVHWYMRYSHFGDPADVEHRSMLASVTSPQ